MGADDIALRAEQHRYPDYHALLEDYFQRGWTDGLPIVPPTPGLVSRFLEAAGMRGDEVLGEVSTRDITVTAEHAAINAVMAGCRPEYMPVVLAAARMMMQPDANAHCVTASLTGAAQVLIINGPLRQQLDVNCDLGCFGPGWRANATIGRALRLFIRNACNAVPGSLDRAAFSQPARYSFCFGENEDASPWLPLHVERGFRAEQSTVSLWSTLTPLEIRVSPPEPQKILDALYDTIVHQHGLWIRHYGVGDHCDLILVLCKEHAECLAAAGWTKQTVRQHLWDRLLTTRVPPPDANSQDTMRLGTPEDIHLVVAGGYGYFVSWMLTPHCGLLLTSSIEQPHST
jgi:hypothetical protein